MKLKRLAASFTGLGFLTAASSVFARHNQLHIEVVKPQGGIDPSTPVGTVISNAITIVFVVAALTVLVFLVIGAFRWITSGGNKENVDTARKMIVNALIGLVILALAFLIARVVGLILNIDLVNLQLPTLDQPR